MRYYIFSHTVQSIPVYERGTPCEQRAKERVKELKDWYGYKNAYYTNELPKKFFS